MAGAASSGVLCNPNCRGPAAPTHMLISTHWYWLLQRHACQPDNTVEQSRASCRNRFIWRHRSANTTYSNAALLSCALAHPSACSWKRSSACNKQDELLAYTRRHTCVQKLCPTKRPMYKGMHYVWRSWLLPGAHLRLGFCHVWASCAAYTTW
jgi:hypothetical protein